MAPRGGRLKGYLIGGGVGKTEALFLGESLEFASRRDDAAVFFPVFDAMEKQFTWVIKQTVQLLARAFQCALVAIVVSLT